MSAIRALSVVLLFFAPNISQAEDTQGFIGAFMDNCATHAGNLKRFSAMIELDPRFEALTPRMLEMVAPNSTDGESAGWLVRNGLGAPYILSLNTIPRGQLGDTEHIICSMIGDHISEDVLFEKLQNIQVLGDLINTSIDKGQRTRLWRAQNITHVPFVMMNDSSPLGAAGVTLSSIAPLK